MEVGTEFHAAGELKLKIHRNSLCSMDYAEKCEINLLEYRGLQTVTVLPSPVAIDPFLEHVPPSVQTVLSGEISPLY